jgi:hypothetical protein
MTSRWGIAAAWSLAFIAMASQAHAANRAEERIAEYTRRLHDKNAPQTGIGASTAPTMVFNGSLRVAQLVPTLTIARPGFIAYYPGTGQSLGAHGAYSVGFIACDATHCVDVGAADMCDADCDDVQHDVPFGSNFSCRESIGDAAGHIVASYPCTFAIDTATNTISIVARHVPATGLHLLNGFATYTTGDEYATPYETGYSFCAPFRIDVAYEPDSPTFREEPDDVQQDHSCPGAEPYASAAMDAAIDILDADVEFSAEPPSPVAQTQHGLTGTWINPRTQGEGFVVENYPSIGLLSIGWFSFDTKVGGPDHQRWYVLDGSTTASPSRIDLGINTAYGGNFAAPPVTTIFRMGSATLRFSDCNHGALDYLFNDGRSGTIDMTRFTSNTSCSAGGDAVVAPPQFLLSGNWFDSATNGQGIQLELNPANRLLFGVWYTYSPHGASEENRPKTQRWYTMQFEGVDPAARHLIGVPLFSTTGGIFDAGAPTSSQAIGSVDIRFESCTAATFAYRITAGEEAGRSGSIALSRVGPAPENCTF